MQVAQCRRGTRAGKRLLQLSLHGGTGRRDPGRWLATVATSAASSGSERARVGALDELHKLVA